MATLTIPHDTVKRLFWYYRALLESRQTEVISSEEMAKLTGFSAAQIRKDLSYFGQFGIPGKGYEVVRLNDRIKNILGIDREWDVALVGVGNMGRALLTYPGFKLQGFKVNRLFDNDPGKIGKTCAGWKIRDIRSLKEELRDNPVNPVRSVSTKSITEKNVSNDTSNGVKIAIIAVPAEAAQEVVNRLVQAGVKAILNFAPTRVTAPPEIKILNIDMTNELARLSYYLTQNIIVPEESLNEVTPDEY